MKQLVYDVLRRIPFFGTRFRLKHDPMFIYSNFFYDEPGSITREELYELIEGYHNDHPDEAITTEVVYELLNAWESGRAQNDK